jgi:hypothetical protein
MRIPTRERRERGQRTRHGRTSHRPPPVANAGQLGLIALLPWRALAAFIDPSFEGLASPSPRTGDVIRTVVALPEKTLAFASV